MDPIVREHLSTSILIRADIGRVYDAFTMAADLDEWFTDGAEVDARPGGSIHFRWKDWGPDHYTGEDGGPVVEARRPELFEFRWHPVGPDVDIAVRIELIEVPEGTIVRLTDSGYPDTERGRTRQLECAAGWGEALALCKFFVEHGVRY